MSPRLWYFMNGGESMEELKIEYLPVTALKPYERNAKKHPQEQVEQIKRSITDYGMNDPIGIWGPKNTIVEGHGRWMACKELGMDTVPVIRLDYLSNEQRRAYALTHNKITMETGMSFTTLHDLINQLNMTLDEYGIFVQDNINGVFDLEDEKPKEQSNDQLIYVVKIKKENEKELLELLEKEVFQYEN